MCPTWVLFSVVLFLFFFDFYFRIQKLNVNKRKKRWYLMCELYKFIYILLWIVVRFFCVACSSSFLRFRNNFFLRYFISLLWVFIPKVMSCARSVSLWFVDEYFWNYLSIAFHIWWLYFIYTYNILIFWPIVDNILSYKCSTSFRTRVLNTFDFEFYKIKQ